MTGLGFEDQIMIFFLVINDFKFPLEFLEKLLNETDEDIRE
jgi:hypothetical protein